MDDRQLLDEFVKAHSQSAFRELVERHLPVVYSTARRLVRDAHLAEEVAQNVFTTLAQKAASIRPPQVLGGWLYNTTRHLAMHAVRSEQRRREREQTAFAMQSLDQPPGDDTGIHEHLEPAMAELATEDRDALVLRFLANRALREVGAELGVSEEAARKRVSRALERLRQLLAHRGITASSIVLGTALASSTLAIPVGLGATIATGALTSATLTQASVITLKWLNAKVAAVILGFCAVGGVGTYLVQLPGAAKASPKPAAGRPAPANSVTGLLKTADGQPLSGAEVCLSTVSAVVPIYSGHPAEIASTVTGADGRFSFPANPENCAVIVVNDKGYGQATVAQLAADPELTLQRWARIEGVLRERTTPQANQTIHLSRTRFGSKIEQRSFRTIHDLTIKTDGAGHYVFPRVAPGDTWISWRTDRGGYDLQYRYFDVQSGQSLTADIGGQGRSIIGRAVAGDSAGSVKFFGSVWPKVLHQMRRPNDWDGLSPDEQASLVAAWEKTLDAKLYNQERCPIDFRLAPDGTFTVPDLPAGDYHVTVASWTGAPVKSRMLSRGTAEITIPEMPTGRSDDALDIGEVKAFSTAPLQPGDVAPSFEASTFEGQPLKLSDQKGKYVLLNFWRSDHLESLDDVVHLKTVQSTWGQDKRFILIGMNLDATLTTAQKYAADNGLTWTQCFFGKNSDVPNRYRLHGPTTLLIGPDGWILQPQLVGAEIVAAVQDALGAK